MFTTLRAKVFAGFLLILLLLVGLGGYAIYSLASLADVTNTSLEKNADQSLAASSMYESLVRIDQAELRMLAGDTVDAGPALVEEPAHFYYALTKAWNTTPPQDSASPLLNDIEARWDDYKGHLDLFYELALHRPKDARKLYEDTLEREIEMLKAKNIALQELNFNAFESAKVQEKSRARNSTIGVILVAALALLIGIGGSYTISRRTVQPLRDLTDSVKGLRAGHLDTHIPISGADEISDLGFEFNRLTERLREFEAMNVSEILREKQKSESIIESIDDPLLLFSADGKLLLMNRAAELLVRTPEQSALGLSLREIFRDDRTWREIATALEHAAQLRDVHAEMPPIITVEHDGRPRYFRIRVARITTDKATIGVLFVFTDITHFKELDQLKSDFIAKVSHEFRTPLTSMTMSLDILDNELVGPLNTEQHDIVDTSKQDARRLSKLIRDLLLLSRLESLRGTERPEEIDLAATIEQLARSIEPQFRERRIQLRIGDVPAGQFEIANEHVGSILTNLLSNALKYTPSGGSVTLETRFDEAKEELIFAVKDTGIGIAPEDRERIFDKFVQVKHRDVPTPGSVGLGLAIVREIAARYDGRVDLESELGKGSTFIVTLHVRRAGTERTRLREEEAEA